MKKIVYCLGLGAILMLLMNNRKAYANTPEDEIIFGETSYEGTGCPAGRATLLLDQSNKTFTIYFSDFFVTAGPRSGKTLDSRSCAVMVSVHVPSNRSILVTSPKGLPGFASLTEGGEGQVDVSFSFAGETEDRLTRNFQGYFKDPFILATDPSFSGKWSACGTDVNVRINISAVARTEGLVPRAHIDLTTVGRGAAYELQMKDCGEASLSFGNEEREMEIIKGHLFRH